MKPSKKLVNFIASIYLSIRKAFSSRFLYEVFAEKYESNGIWERVREYTIKDFSDYINTYPYKSDPKRGAIDFSHPEDKPDYFFADLSAGRDCDNWSRIWLCYLKYHSSDWENVKEIVVLDTSTFKNCFMTSHFITVARNKFNGKWYCFNYEYSGRKFDTMEEAILDVCRWKTYTEENLYWEAY